MAQIDSRKLQNVSSYLLSHPALNHLVSTRRGLRVLAVASVRCNAKSCFLSGSTDVSPPQPLRIFYFISGTDGRKKGDKLETKGQCSYVCERYVVEAPSMWSFAFSSNYTPTAAPLHQESQFLTQQAVSLLEAQQKLRQHRADWQAAAEDLSALPLSSNPMSQAAAYVELDLKRRLSKLTAVDVKDVALGGNAEHAMDAEMQCFYCLLHDPGVKDSLAKFFEGEHGPIVLDIFVSRAPCDHCCRHIVHCQLPSTLEARFGRAEIVISAAAPYLEQGCVGMQKISEAHTTWLTFVPMWDLRGSPAY